MISERSEGQAAAKIAVAVIVGGRMVGVIVAVAVGGTGVGVSGRINLVAARQAKVENRSGRIHKNSLRTEWVRISQRPLSNP